MDFQDLRNHNFELFLDGVSNGHIPLSEVGGVLEVGAGQPNEFTTSFVGGPHMPEQNKLPKNLAGMSYGASGYYPKPFLSVTQRYNNGVYNYVGAYAKLVRYKKPFTSTCITEDCGEDQFVDQELYGRVGNIMSGLYAWQAGFYAQDWYNVDDGAYDAAFWTTHYDPDIDPPIPNKQKWWDQCTKATVRVRFVNDPLREFADVEVALNNLSSTSPQYYQANDLSIFNIGSLQLLNVMTALVTSLGVWI